MAPRQSPLLLVEVVHLLTLAAPLALAWPLRAAVAQARHRQAGSQLAAQVAALAVALGQRLLAAVATASLTLRPLFQERRSFN